MQNITITTEALANLIAAGVDLSETFPGVNLTVVDGGVAPAQTAPAKAPKKDGRNLAARAHNAEARLARRADLSDRRGVTKAERKALAEVLREELGREFTAAEWDEAVKGLKAGEFTLEF